MDEDDVARADCGVEGLHDEDRYAAAAGVADEVDRGVGILVAMVADFGGDRGGVGAVGGVVLEVAEGIEEGRGPLDDLEVRGDAGVAEGAERAVERRGAAADAGEDVDAIAVRGGGDAGGDGGCAAAEERGTRECAGGEELEITPGGEHIVDPPTVNCTAAAVGGCGRTS